MYSKTELSELPRKELQAIAKSMGLKANSASETLISQILEKEIVTPSVESIYEVVLAPMELEAVAAVPEIVVQIEIPAKEEAVAAIESSENNLKVLEKGDSAFVLIGDKWESVIIKRVNKKTYRIAKEDGTELTVNSEEVLCKIPEAIVTIIPEIELANEAKEVQETEVTDIVSTEVKVLIRHI